MKSQSNSKGKAAVVKSITSTVITLALSFTLLVSSVQADKATLNQKETDIGVFIKIKNRY